MMLDYFWKGGFLHIIFGALAGATILAFFFSLLGHRPSTDNQSEILKGEEEIENDLDNS